MHCQQYYAIESSEKIITVYTMSNIFVGTIYLQFIYLLLSKRLPEYKYNVWFKKYTTFNRVCIIYLYINICKYIYLFLYNLT